MDLPLVSVGQGDYRRDWTPRNRREKSVARHFTRETEAEYRAHAKTHLTSHALADFRKCPLLYRQKQLGIIPDIDSQAYLVGRAAHTLILEGRERYKTEYAIGGPINPKTGQPFGANTKAFAEWAAQQNKDVLTCEQAALVEAMVASVRGHDLARELLAEGIAEGVIRTKYCGRPCQARLDFFNPQRGIVDLKTCDDLTWFEPDARRFGYAHQMAFYRALVQHVTNAHVPVHIIAVEKKPPYRCGVWLVSEQTLDAAQRENLAYIAKLSECEAQDTWPTGYETCRILEQGS